MMTVLWVLIVVVLVVLVANISYRFGLSGAAAVATIVFLEKDLGRELTKEEKAAVYGVAVRVLLMGRQPDLQAAIRERERKGEE